MGLFFPKSAWFLKKTIDKHLSFLPTFRGGKAENCIIMRSTKSTMEARRSRSHERSVQHTDNGSFRNSSRGM